MKKNILVLTTAILGLVVMTGCGESTTNTTDSTTDPTTSNSTNTSTETSTDVATNEDLELAKNTYVDKNGVEKPLNMQTLYTNQNSPHLDPLNEQHILVVPFGFQEERYQAVQNQTNLDRINKCFFGTEEEIKDVNGWESVATYYNKSSYGKGKFSGTVLPTWVVWDKSADSCTGGVQAGEYIRTWYIAEYAKENHGDLGEDAKPLSYYDTDNDGYIDLMWIVYSHETVSNDTPWWAYVTYTGNNGNKTNPTLKTLGWASIDWLNSGFGGYDPHTFIHETGHIYGLPDYYDYNGAWSPVGGIDMMDHNMGDHNATSKFTLGWAQPWIADEDCEITLRSFTKTGDCFVIPSPNYNGTAFDEYFMVELVTPEGLNEQDYKYGYSNVSGYSKAGIRIMHADNRVYKSSSTRDVPLTDNPEEGISMRIGNSKMGRSGVKIDGDFWPDAQDSATGKAYAQLTLMEATYDPNNNPLTTSGYNASNNSLFAKGESFSISKWGFASTFMPSGTSLWNKAKTITGWTGNKQSFTVDESITADFVLKVKSLAKNADGEYEAVVSVTFQEA